MRAPFPWFGGKSRIAEVVWAAFGDVKNYVDPFAGSLAVLLSRPHLPRVETVNDLDGLLVNFWRATQADPGAVAHAADWPVSELDLSARHLRLVARRAELTERLAADPAHFDATLAGWWVWGACAWIGSGWCSGEGPWVEREGKLVRMDGGNRGQGINRQLPHLGADRAPGRGIHSYGARRQGLLSVFSDLSARLRNVRIACGDWTRVLGDSVTVRQGETAVFLDPPYFDGAIDYADGVDRSVAHDVREWALANGEKMKIALCGYEGDHEMPGWECVAWKANGGYGSQGADENVNARRERVWFSPLCVRRQATLFGGAR